MAKNCDNGEKFAAAANSTPAIVAADTRQPGLLGHVRIVRARAPREECMNRTSGEIQWLAKNCNNGEKFAAAANTPAIASADARQPGVLGHVRIVRAGLAAYHHQTGRLDCTSRRGEEAMRCVLVCPQCFAGSGNVSKKKIPEAKDTISHCGGRCWKRPIRDWYWIEARIRKTPMFRYRWTHICHVFTSYTSCVEFFISVLLYTPLAWCTSTCT